MEKEFVLYEEALALKELGFDGYCFAFYWWDSHELCYDRGILKSEDYERVSAPLYQQAFRFFRTKGIDAEIMRYPILNTLYGKLYEVNITIDNDTEEIVLAEFETYEEAELACLKKLIEIVKNK